MGTSESTEPSLFSEPLKPAAAPQAAHVRIRRFLANLAYPHEGLHGLAAAGQRAKIPLPSGFVVQDRRRWYLECARVREGRSTSHRQSTAAFAS